LLRQQVRHMHCPATSSIMQAVMNLVPAAGAIGHHDGVGLSPDGG
jgi:hypothetical protein